MESEYQREQEIEWQRDQGSSADADTSKPTWRKEALSLKVVIRPPPAEKGEEQGEPEKRTVSPGECLNILKKIRPVISTSWV